MDNDRATTRPNRQGSAPELISPKTKFLYASPGGLNSTQVYLHIKVGRIEGIGVGTYYYHPEDHGLIALKPGVEIDRGVHLPFINQPIFDEAAFSIFLVADLDAIGPAYGERSLHYVTLEAGIIAHQLEIWGPDYNLGLCQIGAMDFDQIRSHFDLGENHVFVHSLLGGMIPQEAAANGETRKIAEPRPSDKARRLIERIKGLSDAEVKQLLNAERNSQLPAISWPAK